MPNTPEVWETIPPCLRKRFEFTSFVQAIEFVNGLAAVAEQLQHHPDITIRYRRVTLDLTTHDAGAVTERDEELARAADALAAQLLGG